MKEKQKFARFFIKKKYSSDLIQKVIDILELDITSVSIDDDKFLFFKNNLNKKISALDEMELFDSFYLDHFDGWINGMKNKGWRYQSFDELEKGYLIKIILEQPTNYTELLCLLIGIIEEDIFIENEVFDVNYPLHDQRDRTYADGEDFLNEIPSKNRNGFLPLEK